MSDHTLQADRRRSTLAACGSAHFVHDGFSDALYVLLPLWSQAFGLSIAQAGLLRAAFSAAQAGFQIPVGILAERIGERSLLVAGTLLTGTAFACLGWAEGFLGLAGLLLLAGTGSAVQHPLSSALVARAYGDGPLRTALGIYNFTGDLGKVAGPAVLAAAVSIMGWADATAVYGTIGIVAALVLGIGLRRLNVGGSSAGAQTQNGRGWGISHPTGFVSLSAIGVIDAAVRYAFLTLLPFLLARQGAGVATVGLALGLVFAGGAAGKLVCGVLAERVGVIRTAVVTELVTGAGIVAAATLPLGATLVLLPLIGVALHGTSSVLYGSVAEFVDKARQPRAFGLFYTLTTGASIPAPALFGLVGDVAGTQAAVAAIGVFALLTLPLCRTLAAARAAVGTTD